MPNRRGHGEGAIFQRHTADCPPAVDGIRPKHACKGRWVSTVDLGLINGRRVRKTLYGRTRKEVAIKLQKAITAKQTNTLTVGRTTVETWLNYWLDVICVERGLKVNTLKSHRSKVEQYLIPHLGAHRLDKLQPEHIRAMYAAMGEKGLSDATRVQTHAVLHRALKVAVRERKAPYNAADLLDRPQASDVKRTGLTLEQARAVLAEANRRDPTDPRWFLALYLGLRQGEALALRWSDIDLHGEDGPTLRVQSSLAVKPGGELVFQRPKTAKSRAELPLPTVIASRLTVRWAAHAAAGGDVHDLVFAREDGSPIAPRRDWQAWKDLLAAAGVPHVALHAARNTTATLLKSLGVSQADARDILRHKTVAMTDQYQDEDLGRKTAAIAALEAALTELDGEL